MPVFTEYASSSRDLRVLPSFAPPLPRLSPGHSHDDRAEEYEVVVVGGGPAGLMLNLLLARYGLSDDSVLSIDAKPETLKSGQADGLQPRTLETLKSLGLADEILCEGCQMWEVAFWNPSSDTDRIIERTSIIPDVAVPARFPHEVTIHQGRIERVLESDLLRYSKCGIQRSSRLVDAEIDEAGDSEFPVVAVIETEGQRRAIRTKHLVGADGAHSVVRRCMGLRLEGESSDHIWGVVDLVLDTDFPDIRRRTAIHSPAGSVMVIPRERIATGDYLTRLYVQVPGDVNPDNDLKPANGTSTPPGGDTRTRRSQVTLEGIFQQAVDAFKPYDIKPKDGTDVDWWAAYQIGQRVSNEFTVKDSKGINRVFIVGDACHTHSPKAGQGMNVSMMDSFNLAWKLAYSIHGLTPHSAAGKSDPVLDTYHTERHTIAQELIAFDRDFSSMFSGKMGAPEDGVDGLTHDQFLEVFSKGNGFTSGCGIEYPENVTVERTAEKDPIHGTDYLSGLLRPGRRLLNVKAKRHADGYRRDLQDDFPSTGRFRILVLSSSDLLDPQGTSARTLTALGSRVLPRFPESLIEQVVIHPRLPRDFMWHDVPRELKMHSEMRFYSGYEMDDVYKVYGVDAARGAMAVVRPDGYVGVTAALEDVSRVEKFLERCGKPSFRPLLRLRAVKVLLACALLWLAAFEYCRLLFWREPHSAFFDESHVYDLKYSLYREREAQHLISQYNSLSAAPDPVKASSDPLICAAFVTIRRTSDNYFDPSVGSALEGLDPRERRALYLNVLFADTDPGNHPSWGQKWVDRLADSAGSYHNITGDQFEHLRKLEEDRNFREKGVFDYIYALSSCQASNAPYTIIFEDDIILAEGWLTKTLKSLIDIDRTLRNDAWIYLRLFYSETFLSWSSADFAYRNMSLIFALAALLALACLSALRRSTRCRPFLDPATMAVISLLSVPAFTALLYMIGKYSLMPLRGVVEMNAYGCCTQGLVFPTRQIDGLIAHLRETGNGQTDLMIEDYAEHTGLTRYALAPQQLQHVGLKSSRDNPEINARSTLAFWFEENDPGIVRREHDEILRSPDVEGLLVNYS